MRLSAAAALLTASLLCAGPVQADRALLVGVGQFKTISKLDGPENDVVRMAAFLKAELGLAASDIRILKDGAASKDAIVNAINSWLIQGSKPNERVIFYFSGHGTQVTDTSGDEEDGLDEVLVPFDFSSDPAKGMFISDDLLNTLFAKAKGRHVTLIIDACHSGTIFRDATSNGVLQERKAPVADPKPALTAKRKEEPGLIAGAFSDAFNGGGDTVIWSAVAAGQLAYSDLTLPGGPRGVFTDRFIAAFRNKLADADRDGKVSYAELLAYLRKESAAFCAKNSSDCKAGMSPEIEISRDLMLEPAFAAPPPSVSQAESKIKPAAGSTRPKPPGESTPSGLPSATIPPPGPFLPPPPVIPTPGVSSALTPSGASQELAVRISANSNSRRLGESISLSVTAVTGGQLMVFGVAASGETRLLFPNPYSALVGRSNVLQPGEILDVPGADGAFQLVASPPAGQMKIVALLVEESADMTGFTKGEFFRRINNQRNYFSALAYELQQLRRDADPALNVRALRWASADLTIAVEPDQ